MNRLTVCACGKVYDDASWARLRYLGIQSAPDLPDVELRNCRCGSTLGREVIVLGPICHGCGLPAHAERCGDGTTPECAVPPQIAATPDCTTTPSHLRVRAAREEWAGRSLAPSEEFFLGVLQYADTERPAR